MTWEWTVFGSVCVICTAVIIMFTLDKITYRPFRDGKFQFS